ncbi:vanadium-dependent haloperoxidase [Amycolatopsis alba]|uniref:Phosphatase PAP2 family protein n=1 Tax=Amycolatopsis alba DSM 44262 TaxID=1125972 RepID=A0A229S7M0_AMYAL|nr:vanadium-dependent haloperoxidase [Amycolatopsis alba]OXM54933.1 phosphatase PAP2 family protein [Amycolatopsis alba DSM 44262]
MTTPLSRRRFLVIGGTTAALAVTGLPALAEPATGTPVIAWNRTLLRIVRTPGAHPATVHPTRSFAMLHAAVHDAVAATRSQTAAASQAAHDVLASLYPAMAADFAAQLARELATAHDPAPGIRAGKQAAEQILRARADDGSTATPPTIPPGTEPGQYRPTPPGFAPAVFTHWSAVRPFVLARASVFRPGRYPELTSARYATAANEVASLGQDTSTTRTADQTEQAKFWAAPIWNLWNEIAQSVLATASTASAAQVFARLNLAFADAVIAFYDAKYHYRIWRPITAVRLADTDGNPATTADPAWNSLATTPADPAYPGAHSVISQAGATILRHELGSRRMLSVTSEALPGIVRHFRTFQQVADEAGESRIFAGVHSRLDHVSGRRLGSAVARVVLPDVHR